MDNEQKNNTPTVSHLTAEALPPGSQIGRYEVVSLLGGGGMGVVYRAVDTRLQREVAIKVLHEKERIPGMRERLLREARAVSSINHPSICTLHDIGEHNGEPYLVLELLEGETLRDRIRKGPLSNAEVVEYSMQIADALAEAHGKAIVHRDIKPANIFLAKKASGVVQVKVLDFGLAKKQMDDMELDSTDLTGPGNTIGTISYMSPEQARGEPLDARTDLFSFGTVMYEMATGNMPFTGQTSAVVFVQLLERDPKPVQEWNRQISAKLAAVIDKALKKQYADRYQTAGEIHADLEAVWVELMAAGQSQPVVEAKLAPVLLDTPVLAGEETLVVESAKQEAAPSVASGYFETRREAPSQEVAGQPREVARQPLEIAGQPQASASPVSPEAKQVPATYTDPPTSDPPTSRTRPYTKEIPKFSKEKPKLPTYNLTSGPADPLDARRLSDPYTTAGWPLRGEKTPRRPRGSAAEPKKRSKAAKWILLTTVLLAITLGVAIYIQFVRTNGGAILQQGDTILVGHIDNKTESTLLDPGFRVGLQLELEQSPYFNSVLGGDGVNSISGEKGTVIGTISGAEPYVIDLQLVPPGGSKPIAEVQDTAQDMDDMLATIDRMTLEFRRQFGESSISRDNYSRALHQEATSSLDAFEAFSTGEDIVASHGKLSDAISDYLQALAGDKYFSLASERLAILYAETGNAQAAAQYADSAYSGRQTLSERSELEIEVVHAALVAKDDTAVQNWLKQLHKDYPQDDLVNNISVNPTATGPAALPPQSAPQPIPPQ